MGQTPLTIMRLAAVLSLTLCLCACAGSPSQSRSLQTVRGIVTLEKDTAVLQDCGSKRRVSLGAMAAGHFLHLRQRTTQLSLNGRRPVTGDFSGYLTHHGKRAVLERPALLGLAAGHCVSPKDFPEDYRAG